MTQANAQVTGIEILHVGHALVGGYRAEKGGKPSKDSIWGVAVVNNTVVTFSGRRNAKVYRYKTYKKADLEQVKELFAAKVAGTAGKDYTYTELNAQQRVELVPGLAEFVKSGYYKAIREGKVNTNSTKPKKVEKAEVVAETAAETTTQ